MHGETLTSFLVILVVAVGVQFVAGQFRIPSVVGFLIAGLMIRNNGFFEFGDTEFVSSLSELGIILMLFVIGLEFSIEDLLKQKKMALLGGGLQFAFTSALFTGIFSLFGYSPATSFFYGVLATLSSTAVVIKLLTDQGRMNTLVGRGSFSILIFQDIAAVVFIVFLPLLGESETKDPLALSLGVFQGLATLAGLFFAARYLVPFLLYQILKVRNRELFLLTIIAMITGITVISSSLGLSVALGAFLAGLVISESDYSNYTLNHIIPFQDLFTSLFFISVGFLFEPMFLLENAWLVLKILLVVFVLKILLLYPICVAMGLNSSSSLAVAFTLSQIGEFSFILATLGNEQGLFGEFEYKTFVTVTLVSMALTPLLMKTSEKLEGRAFFKTFSGWIDRRRASFTDDNQWEISDHLVIVGFGITGKLHAKIAGKMAVPYVVIEMNPITVRNEKKRGTNITLGDASSPHLLKHVQIAKARMAVVSVPDHAQSMKIVRQMKTLNPDVFIIARSRFIRHMEEIMQAGADKAVSVELESALEMLAEMMGSYFLEDAEIRENLKEIRHGFYSSQRRSLDKTFNLKETEGLFSDLKTLIVRLGKDSPLLGKSLRNAGIRSQWNLNLIACKRREEMISNPEADFVFRESDHLMLFGGKEDVIRFDHYNRCGEILDAGPINKKWTGENGTE